MRSVYLTPILLFTLLMALLIGLFAFGHSAQALSVQKMRFGVHPDKTRVVIELDETTEFRAFMLPKNENNPYRLVIDMPDFDWGAGVIKAPKTSAITDVRSGTIGSGIERLVIDLNQPAKIINAFILPPKGNSNNRFVIDYIRIIQNKFTKTNHKSFGTLPDISGDLDQLIASQMKEEVLPPKIDPAQKIASATEFLKNIITPEKKPAQAAKPPPISIPAATPVPQKSQQQSTPPLSPLRKPLIVIDAGHGGADSGAVGAEKQLEKHVTLATAKTLKKLLEKTGRYNVALTRSDDRYLKLRKRVSIARAKDADLFISLHADSINKPGVKGASIYTLSNKASDAQTAKLARRENQADLIAGVDLSHEDKDVANILLDLAMRDTMNQSKFFANTVVKHMRMRGIQILPRPHRYAGFAVLKAPDTPSVLFEMGFMSNKKEARLLSSASHREKIASSLVSAIDSYFQKVSQNNR